MSTAPTQIDTLVADAEASVLLEISDPYKTAQFDVVQRYPLIGTRVRLRRRCRHRLPAVRCGLTLRPPLPLITAHADQDDQI
jgi:hypothetical protein